MMPSGTPSGKLPASTWHRDYSPSAWRSRATEDQKRIGWEMTVRIEKSFARYFTRRTSNRLRRRLTPFTEGLEGLYRRPS